MRMSGEGTAYHGTPLDGCRRDDMGAGQVEELASPVGARQEEQAGPLRFDFPLTARGVMRFQGRRR